MNVNVAYTDLVSEIVEDGEEIDARNGRVVRLARTTTFTFDRAPLVSIRKTPWRTSIREMAWFLSGSTCLDDAHPSVWPWWKPWADDEGYLYGHYGQQFRWFAGEVDQLQGLVDGLRDAPYSRRHLMTMWDPQSIKDASLPPCHGTVIQLFCRANGTLDLTMYQRSTDVVVGLPANLIQYWALLMYLAHQCKRTVGKFTWLGGDVHIYQEHLPLANKIATLIPYKVTSPNLTYTPSSDDFVADDFALDAEYEPVVRDSASLIV